jgi:xanthine dehydrogenase small subunit
MNAPTPVPGLDATERPIRFVHQGRVVEVPLRSARHPHGAAPTRTVLEWLREDARCTGTKEGCAEGDCGACTVVVGRLGADGTLQMQPVNACIQFLPTLDGKALFTVEDVAAPDGTLHPAQQAMVDCHGSQCGFCTPGFVMSLWDCHRRHTEAGTRPTRQMLADDLSGNLCRCTGYRPILDAGERMFDAPTPTPAPRFDSAPVQQALQTLAADAPLDDLPGIGWSAPRTLDALAKRRAAHPEARVLAGSTDVGLWVTKQFRPLPQLISVGDVTELQAIAATADGGLRIGAGASLEAAWRALATRWPALRDVWLRFASLPIRQAGTMGGNVANGSPIGDAAPVLMALGASLVLNHGGQRRTVPLDAFYVDYMKNVLQPGEFVEAIEVPAPAPHGALRAYKISKRFDCDISAVCAGLALERAADGTVTAARLSFGGLAATVRRAASAEAALVGHAWDEIALARAVAALATDFRPLTDLRASADYRLTVSGNLLRRFWLETRGRDPMPESAVSVFARADGGS